MRYKDRRCRQPRRGAWRRRASSSPLSLTLSPEGRGKTAFSPLSRTLSPEGRGKTAFSPLSLTLSHVGRGKPPLLQVVPQLFRAGGVAELAQRLRLDLADPFAGHPEPLPHLFQRPLVPVDQPEPQLQHAPLARRQSVEHVLDLRVQHRERSRVRRRHRLAVFHEVAEVRILLLTDRRLQRDWVLRDLHDLAHLLGRDAHLLADLVVRWLAAQLLQQPARDPHQLVDRLHHVHGDADRPRLVRDRARDGLPDPPRRIGRELVALVIVDLLDRADQAHVAFLDQVEEGHAAPDVLLRDRHDQPQVGLGQPLLRLVRALVALGQPVPRDAIRLERLSAHARSRPIGDAPALRGSGVGEVGQLAQVGQAEQLQRDVLLLTLALDRRQPLDHFGQQLVDRTLAPVQLFDDVQRLHRIVQRLGLDRLRQLDLVVRRQQRDAPDLLQVHAHRVVQGDRVHHLDVEEHLVVDLLHLFEVLLAVGDFDPDLLERGEDPEDLVWLGVDLGEALEDVVGRQVALLFALDDELLGRGHKLVFELRLRLVRRLRGLGGLVVRRLVGFFRRRHDLGRVHGLRPGRLRRGGHLPHYTSDG